LKKSLFIANQHWQNKLRFEIIPFLFIVVLFVVLSVFNRFIGVTTDELGYLERAARLAGYDWKDASNYNAFYGIGSGILWVPFFLIFNSFTQIYRSIIIFNGILLGISYLFAYNLTKRFFAHFIPAIASMCSLYVVLIPAQIYYAIHAAPETLLFFLFWLIITLVVKCKDQGSIQSYLLTGLILGYSIFVHLRMVLVVVIIICYLIVINVKNKQKLLYVLSCVTIVLLSAALWIIIKNNLLAATQSSELSLVNTNLNLQDRIKEFYEHPKWFIKGIIGTLFNVLAQYNIIFVAPILALINMLIRLKKTSRSLIARQNGVDFLLLLVVINLFHLFALAATKMTDQYPRLDHVVFGRYMDMVVGPLILIGLYLLCINISNLKNYLGYTCILLFICCLVAVLPAMLYAKTKYFAYDPVILSNFFSWDNANADISYLLLKAVCCIVLFICIVLLSKHIVLAIGKKKKWAIVLLTIMFLFSASTAIKPLINVREQKEINYKRYCRLANILGKFRDYEIVYVSQNHGLSEVSVLYLQEILMKKRIYVVDFTELNGNQNVLYLTRSEQAIMSNDYEIIGSAAGFNFYQWNENELM
jgi:hypothetical protein